jgi:hypothetical protein
MKAANLSQRHDASTRRNLTLLAFPASKLLQLKLPHPFMSARAVRSNDRICKLSPPSAHASDNYPQMSALTCCGGNLFATLSRAAAKAASAKLRRLSVLPVKQDWAARAAVCERCHMRVLHRGVSYCGQPLLRQIDRDPAIDGCGCPTREKAKDPKEHCPIDSRNQPAHPISPPCSCKWCSL